MKRALLVIECLLFVTVLYAQSLTIHISGIRNGKGMLCIAIYTNSRQFETDKPYRKLAVSKEEVKDGKITVIVKELPAGQYGIALLDDENNNGKMDYRLLLPAEGCGFSNYRHSGLKRPKYEDFDFDISERNNQVCVELRHYYYENFRLTTKL